MSTDFGSDAPQSAHRWKAKSVSAEEPLSLEDLADHAKGLEGLLDDFLNPSTFDSAKKKLLLLEEKDPKKFEDFQILVGKRVAAENAKIASFKKKHYRNAEEESNFRWSDSQIRLFRLHEILNEPEEYDKSIETSKQAANTPRVPVASGQSIEEAKKAWSN